MVRKIILFLLLLLIISCVTTNNFNKARFNLNRFKVKPNHNSKIYKIIDTLSFYKAIKSIDKYGKIDFITSNTGLKFYDNGRVGFFKNINFNNSDLNPKKAQMMLYNYTKDSFIIESFTPSPYNSYKLTRKIVLNKSSRDTLYIKTIPSSVAGERITTFVRIPLRKEFLIYKPDGKKILWLLGMTAQQALV